MVTWHGIPLVAGAAAGPLLVLEEPVSFWGGVDPETGEIRDTRHPQAGAVVTGSVLVTAEGRGSSSASTVLAEMIRTGRAPAALVLGRADPIIVLGAVVASELYGVAMPVVAVTDPVQNAPSWAGWASVTAEGVITVAR
jgi:predicted aconitase with swiveling domain